MGRQRLADEGAELGALDLAGGGIQAADGVDNLDGAHDLALQALRHALRLAHKLRRNLAIINAAHP
ncbi:MAG: hypothetical protein OQL07_05240 [Gammaproteobacteria bacterium]|nr:hypothetical protein [Gammaproteobacteria bacterium]